MANQTTAEIAVTLKNVTVQLGGRTVLDNLSLDIAAGQVTAIMGPSGAGKTIIMRLITRQIRPNAGEVWLRNTRVDQLKGRDLGQYRRNLGVLLQNGALFTDLTCFDNVALPLREHTELPEALIKRLVLIKLQAVGLRGAAHLYPAALSGGMNRRVAMARAMALDPDVMLYDEPFAGLDPISLGVSLRLIREVNDVQSITSVVITHDVDEVARLADHCFIVADGGVVASGSPTELSESQHPLVKQFMTGQPDGPVPFHYPAADISSELLEPSA